MSAHRAAPVLNKHRVEAPMPASVARGARLRCWSLVAVAFIAVVLAAIDPRIGTAAFMLMFILAGVSRRREAREAREAALPPSDRPSP